MSEYANQIGVRISEIARLEFYDSVDGSPNNAKHLVTIVIQVDFLKVCIDHLQQMWNEHQRKLADQTEINKKLS